jgi:deoxyhypusine synthase
MADQGPPQAATDAVLVHSEEMPEGAQKVEELDFDDIDGPITAEHLLQGMQYMGFQASSIGEAVRIINAMVCTSRICSWTFCSEVYIRSQVPSPLSIPIIPSLSLIILSCA